MVTYKSSRQKCLLFFFLGFLSDLWNCVVLGNDSDIITTLDNLSYGLLFRMNMKPIKSRFVGDISGDKKSAAELLCCTFGYLRLVKFCVMRRFFSCRGLWRNQTPGRWRENRNLNGITFFSNSFTKPLLSILHFEIIVLLTESGLFLTKAEILLNTWLYLMSLASKMPTSK